MLVQVFKLGTDEIVSTFSDGLFVLGRGSSLQCNDKRISRTHATLEIKQDTVHLTSTHLNPCFLRTANSKTLRILKNGCCEELNDGDSFALLPDDFWFQIRIFKDKVKLPVEEEPNIKEITELKTELEEELKEEVNDESEKVPSSEENQTATTSKARRERCWYTYNCYQKSLVHKQNYSHPGDSDFETDPEDNRPTCSYGAHCYRKNKEHRKQYKHPARDLEKKRKRRKVEQLNAATSQEINNLLEPELEDPFLDDDSDEYDCHSEEYDSDWVENEEEETEDVNRLVKEAKKFVGK